MQLHCVPGGQLRIFTAGSVGAFPHLRGLGGQLVQDGAVAAPQRILLLQQRLLRTPRAPVNFYLPQESADPTWTSLRQMGLFGAGLR